MYNMYNKHFLYTSKMLSPPVPPSDWLDKYYLSQRPAFLRQQPRDSTPSSTSNMDEGGQFMAENMCLDGTGGGSERALNIQADKEMWLII